MNFSRRKLTHPAPPLPAATSMMASSTNFTMENPEKKKPRRKRQGFHTCVCRGA
jgi:hypothetical protein